MKRETPQQRIAALRDIIAHHARQYHTHDQPEISDEAYDALVRELADLEQKYPEFSAGKKSEALQVGGKILEGFVKTKHRVPQWSYDNVFGFDELKQWDERNKKIVAKKSEDRSQKTGGAGILPLQRGGAEALRGGGVCILVKKP